MIRHNAFREYYASSEYRGFRKVRHRTFQDNELVEVTFGNGHKEIKARGQFVEQALAQAFKAIDAYQTRKARQTIYIGSPPKSY